MQITRPNKPMIIDFHFPIPQDKFTARYAELDRVKDGVYPLSMSMNGQVFQSIDVWTIALPRLKEYRMGQLLTDAMQRANHAGCGRIGPFKRCNRHYGGA